MAMEGDGFSFLSPEHVPLFKVGDNVHVFEGTGTGQVKMRSVAWFGRVVGKKDGKFQVRNRILAGRGSPALVEGQYLTLQTDFGLGVESGERTHYRNLPKRTRDRIEQTVDRRNECEVKSVRQEIKRLKTKQAVDTEALRDRAEKVVEQSNAASNDAKLKNKEQLQYWMQKCDTWKTKKANSQTLSSTVTHTLTLTLTLQEEAVQQHKESLAKVLSQNKIEKVLSYLL
jgi:hypothetical protein